MGSYERNNYDSDKRNDGIHAKDFVIGAVTGAIIGSLAALLFTPKSGRELRQNINHQAYTIKDKTDHLRSQAMNKGSELSSTVKGKTNSISRKVSEQSIGLVNKVRKIKPIEDDEANPVDELFGHDPNSEIQRKLDETKKAFDETENKLGHY
ncbi:YtxH domain-containing protein [Niallia sp. Krafla_26]|uniref:YtxH domain-containing protein n=1 Tax=Niallia sp. Krafla_26 TaxID=3064703 RepID=UPI003D1668F5